jgi:hypothetical protein
LWFEGPTGLWSLVPTVGDEKTELLPLGRLG